MLFFRNSDLIFDNSWDDKVIEGNYADNRWHTVAVVVRGKVPHIYVDGELKQKRRRPISKDRAGHVFQIGAGTEEYGYNYKGDISHVLFFDKALSEEAIEAFAKGKEPKETATLRWVP